MMRTEIEIPVGSSGDGGLVGECRLIKNPDIGRTAFMQSSRLARAAGVMSPPPALLCEIATDPDPGRNNRGRA
jgi:hypothetical protein